MDRLTVFFIVATTLHDDDELQEKTVEFRKEFIIGEMKTVCEQGCASIKACLPYSKSNNGRWECDCIYEQYVTSILRLDIDLWKLGRFPGIGLFTRSEIDEITTPFKKKLEMTLIQKKPQKSHSLTDNESTHAAKRRCEPRYKNGRFLYGKSSVWYTSDVDYVYTSDIDYV